MDSIDGMGSLVLVSRKWGDREELSELFRYYEKVDVFVGYTLPRSISSIASSNPRERRLGQRINIICILHKVEHRSGLSVIPAMLTPAYNFVPVAADDNSEVSVKFPEKLSSYLLRVSCAIRAFAFSTNYAPSQ